MVPHLLSSLDFGTESKIPTKYLIALKMSLITKIQDAAKIYDLTKYTI
jgi:hypothetical protein